MNGARTPAFRGQQASGREGDGGDGERAGIAEEGVAVDEARDPLRREDEPVDERVTCMPTLLVEHELNEKVAQVQPVSPAWHAEPSDFWQLLPVYTAEQSLARARQSSSCWSALQVVGPSQATMRRHWPV